MIKHLIDVVRGKAPLKQRRSPHWYKIRNEYLKNNPECVVCGGRKNLQVHHRVPFHMDRTLELVESNLITLCESNKNGIQCHLLVGHLGSFKSVNKTVVEDALTWRKKLKERP